MSGKYPAPAFRKKSSAGFTLIEVLVTIALIVTLSTMIIMAINPTRQFARSRNSQRFAAVTAILNAVGQNIADHKGTFNCSAPGAVIDDTVRTIRYTATIAPGLTDLRPCLVPVYIPEVPIDPSLPDAHVAGPADYDTQFTIVVSSTTKRLTVCAPGGVEPAVESSSPICITR
jgi:prepilin-type N-terminal cleavage/methylation domain-containing protein